MAPRPTLKVAQSYPHHGKQVCKMVSDGCDQQQQLSDKHAGVQVGSIIGLYLNGWISAKIGYRKTMLGALVLMVAFIFLPFFAQNVETILAGAILQGIPWGVFQTLTVTYASEVMPTNLRAYLTTYVNLCWVMGQLIAAGVLKGCSGIEGQWSYRIPFASTYADIALQVSQADGNSPMDLAPSYLLRHLAGARISLVAGP